MIKTTRAADDHTAASADKGTVMERLMAINAVERQIIRTDPKLRLEIGFQFVALVFCPPFLAFAVYKVAIGLFAMSSAAALLLAVSVAFGLFTIDRFFLVELRGDASASARRAVLKVRALSVALIATSFVLSAADTFKDEISQVLDAAKAARRTELEQSARYQAEWAEARNAMAAASEATKRAEEAHAQIGRLKIEQARAWEEHRNQCQGNTTANKKRTPGCGPEARGAEAAANRLGLEIQTADQDLIRLGNVEERMLAARRQFEKIDTRLDGEAARAVGGAPQKVDALILMLENGWSARLAVAYMFLIGLVPDLLLLVAMGRVPNHDLFVQMRQIQNETVMARLAQIRRELRQEQANGLAPFEVRLTAVPPPQSATTSAPTDELEPTGRAASKTQTAGERT
jgi:hypothetical protein